MSIEFLITSLIIVASPGPGVLYTLAAGLSRGARASLVASVACTLGIIPHMVAAITGVAALLHASAMAFNVLKYAGVAYLLYMAWRTLQEHGALAARMLELSLVFMAETLVVFALYGLFAASVRNHITSRPQILTWLRRTFAGAFVLLGLKLAAAER